MDNLPRFQRKVEVIILQISDVRVSELSLMEREGWDSLIEGPHILFKRVRYY